MSSGVAELPALPSRAPPPVQVRPALRPRWRGAFLPALLAAGLWHAFWVLGFEQRPRAPSAVVNPAPALRMADVPSGDEPMAADPRALWSPALFSLPTPWGFSRPVLEARMESRLLSGAAAVEPRLLERPPAHSALSAGLDLPIEDLLMGHLSRASLPPLEAQVFQAAAGPAASRVELTPDWAGATFTAMPLPDLWETAGDRPWEVTAHLEVDAGGRVTHVFLVRPSDQPRINANLERALRSWHMEPGPAVRSGRVVIRAAGPAAAPPDAQRNSP